MNGQEESRGLGSPTGGPPWTVAQECAYQELVARGVRALPQQQASGWTKTGVWFLAWIVLAGCLFTALLWRDDAGASPSGALVLQLSGAEARPILGTLILSLPGLLLGVRALSGLAHAGTALQVIGEALFFFRRPIQALIGVLLLFGKEWRVLNAYWVALYCGVCCLPLIFMGYETVRLGTMHRVVHEEGLEERWLGHRRDYQWANLRLVRASCYEREDRFFYDLEFDNGKEFYLVREDRRGIAELDAIDRRLVELGVRKERLSLEQARRCASVWPNREERTTVEQILTR